MELNCTSSPKTLKEDACELSEHLRICGAHFISGCSLVVQYGTVDVFYCNYKCMLFQKLNNLVVSVEESQ